MIEFAPFALDVANQCLWHRGDDDVPRRIVLRPKAYALLCYFVEHAGDLVTEDELLEAIWPKVYVQAEAVKGRLFEVRTALGDSAKKPKFIETLPRRGYRFIAPVTRTAAPRLAVRPTPHTTARCVGREPILTALKDAAQKASAGQRQLVFVSGEPGIGKSSLVREFQWRTDLHAHELRVASGQCVEGFGGKEAYYPVLEALESLCSGPAGPSVVQILATQAPTWLVQIPALMTKEHRDSLQLEMRGVTKERMLREIGSALESIAVLAPLLLVFEDVHWVDPSTVDFFSALARRSTPARLMVVATLRPLELVLSNGPLKQVKQDLLSRGLCDEVHVDPLSPEDVSTFVGEKDASTGGSLAALIYRHTEGNPLFMVAALESLQQRGLVTTYGGVWSASHPNETIEVEVPETLRQMIEAQLDRLSADQLRALEIASVEGVKFSPTVCAWVAGTDEEVMDDTFFSVARTQHLVAAAGDVRIGAATSTDAYAFVHSMYREVLYRRLSPGRRSRLHQQVGLKLESLGGTGDKSLAPELAHHFESSCDWPRAVRYLKLAADLAEERFAPDHASKLLERVVELSGKLETTQRVDAELEALDGLARLSLLAYAPTLTNSFLRLAERAAFHGRIDVQTRALRDAVEHLSSSDGEQTRAALSQAAKLGNELQNPVQRSIIQAHCAMWRVSSRGWSAEDERIFREALEVVGHDGPSDVLATLRIDFSFVLLCSSRYLEAYELAREGLVALLPAGAPNPCVTHPQAFAAYVTFNACMFTGRWSEADAIATTTFERFVRNGNAELAQVMRLRTMWLHLFAQDHEGAAEIFEEVRSVLGDRIRPTHRRLLLNLGGAAQVHLGNLTTARSMLADANNAMEGTTAHSAWRSRAMLELSWLELALAEAALQDAQRHAERMVELTLADAEVTWQVLAREASMRVAMANNNLELAHTHYLVARTVSEIHDVPLARWRLLATASKLFALRGEPEMAKTLRLGCAESVARLADSLPETHPLRSRFLSSTAVRNAVAESSSPSNPAKNHVSDQCDRPKAGGRSSPS